MSGNGVDLASIYGAILALSAELKTVKAEGAPKAASWTTLPARLLEERVGHIESRGPAA